MSVTIPNYGWLEGSGGPGNSPSNVPMSRLISTTAPLAGGGALSSNRTLSISGLTTVGAANQIPGVNSAGSAWEYKTLIAGAGINISHASGTITVSASGGGAGGGGWQDAGTVIRQATLTDQVAIGTASPSASAILQADSTTQGLLPPRMTTTQRDLIASPATGLLIYNLTTGVLNVYDGATWVVPGAGGTTHDLLSATHSDVTVATRVRGDLLVVNTSNSWARKPVGTAGTFLRSDGADPSWQGIQMTDLSGTLPITKGGTGTTTGSITGSGALAFTSAAAGNLTLNAAGWLVLQVGGVEKARLQGDTFLVSGQTVGTNGAALWVDCTHTNPTFPASATIRSNSTITGAGNTYGVQIVHTVNATNNEWHGGLYSSVILGAASEAQAWALEGHVYRDAAAVQAKTIGLELGIHNELALINNSSNFCAHLISGGTGASAVMSGVALEIEHDVPSGNGWLWGIKQFSRSGSGGWDKQLNVFPDFGVDGDAYIYGHRLALGGLASQPAFDLSLGGSANRVIQVERHLTAATSGVILRVQAGGGTSGGTNLAGGVLQLAGGIATGNGASSVEIHTVTPNQGSGTTDRSPTAKVYITGSGQLSVGQATPNAAAIVQIDSTTMGLLPPRMTGTQRDAISSPPAGLIIYNTSTAELNLYTSAWGAIGSGGGGGSHELLSATHTDTAASAVTRGSIIVGNATPAWAELTIGAAGAMLRSSGNDAVWSPIVAGPVVTLTDAATIATDAATANQFRVVLGGNRTLGAPSGPTDGQWCRWEIYQDGTGSRGLTLTTGAGGFSFSTDLPSYTPSTTAGACDIISACYHAGINRWRIAGIIKGFAS